MTAAEIQRLLLEAIERIDGEIFRKHWGYETPSPRKLIREGLAIARRCVQAVPLTEGDYVEAVLRSLQNARDRQDACGVSDDGWRDVDGYILAGIWDAYREAEKLKSS
jgi:hypothetical protein